MKGKKDGKLRKAYIAWEDNVSRSSNSSSEEEIANVCLMADSTDDTSVKNHLVATISLLYTMLISIFK